MKVKKGDDIIRLVFLHLDDVIARFASFGCDMKGVTLEHGYFCTVGGHPHIAMDRGCLRWTSSDGISFLSINMFRPFDPIVMYRLHTLLPFEPQIKIYYPGCGAFFYKIVSFESTDDGWRLVSELITINTIVG